MGTLFSIFIMQSDHQVDQVDQSYQKISDPVENTTKLLSTKTPSDRAHLFNTLSKIYEREFRPPGSDNLITWIRLAYVDQKTFDKYAKRAQVYTTSNLSDRVIQRLCIEREPVNIGMKRYYDHNVMIKIFGYQVSYYQRYYEKTKTLAPNIGIYTYAPVDHGNKHHDVHFYHAIGISLDDKEQPDYKVLSGRHFDHHLLIGLYANVFECIFQCAEDQKLTSIVMSLVGNGVFSNLFPGGSGAFQKYIWVPGFQSVAKKYPWVTVSFMGIGDKDPYIQKYMMEKGYLDMGRFPDILSNQLFDVDKTLIVNSWDPHSFPGNGNEGDQSLDGWIGRCSGIQFFGSGLTNPYILNNIHRVPEFLKN